MPRSMPTSRPTRRNGITSRAFRESGWNGCSCCRNVNKLERRERVRTSVMKQLDANPELKEAYRKLVKNLPAEQQEKAMTSIAARTLRTITPRQQQQSKGAQV